MGEDVEEGTGVLLRHRSLVQRALPRTINLLILQQELAINKGCAAFAAVEAARIRMPVHVTVTNACLIRTDTLLAIVAILRKTNLSVTTR